MKTIRSQAELATLHSDESAIIRASGKYPDGGTFTDCYALPVPMDITDSEDRYWRILVHGDTWLQSLVKETGIQLPATLLHPTWFDQEDVERVARALFEAEDTAQGYPIELCRWEAENPNDPHDPLSWHAYWEDRARAALGALGEVVA